MGKLSSCLAQQEMEKQTVHELQRRLKTDPPERLPGRTGVNCAAYLRWVPDRRSFFFEYPSICCGGCMDFRLEKRLYLHYNNGRAGTSCRFCNKSSRPRAFIHGGACFSWHDGFIGS